ncbi:phage tail tip lysozyme [Aquibium sp. ELW1220]|uniref:phage tail tip lysozyme n=1 Tax=Aquibium sp. ELW1220 TaxID=2976766 RepID=UPI0025B06C4F|nr:phage tail tip lysozyme [Aquibium sp. ELW1220]MDN2579189.1 phage tail tip lysozyme [Aquibium sp. ELW1220]
MARLPTKDSLSGPAPLRSGRAIASVDTTGLGRGIAAAGGAIADIGADMMAQQAATGLSMAEVKFTGDSLGLENRYQDDPRYDTFATRAPKDIDKIVNDAGALITDRRTRERWVADAKVRAVRLKDGITDIGRRKFQEAKKVGIDSSLQKNMDIFADPNTPNDVRAKVRADMEGSIQMAEQTGLLSPFEAAQRRERYLKGGDLTRARLAVQANPDAITGPLPERVADRASAAMRYYQSRGWTREQAAGIVGNLLGESNLNTGALNPGDGRDGSNSIGIGQWNAERARNLKAYAAANRADWQDFGVQLAFVDHELRTSETAAANALRNSKTIDEATAAFVGYERPAGWSSGNPRGAHNFDGRLKFALQSAGERINPDWFDRLSPEDRQLVQDEASVRKGEMIRDAAARQKAAYASHKDRLELEIMTGNVRSEQSIVSDAVLNDGDKASLLRTFRTQMEDTMATNVAVAEFANGSLRVDPYEANSKKLIDNVYSAATQVAPESVQHVTEELVKQTGVVPRQALNLIRQGMESTDMAAVVAAGQAAQRIASINPAALARRDGGAAVQSFADDFSHFITNLNLSPEDAARRIMSQRDPANRLQRKALEPAVKEFMTDLEKFNLAGQFDESLLGVAFNARLGFDTQAELGIHAEFRAIAEEQFYKVNGDAELATSRAVAEMKRLYGVTNLTGDAVVIKHPPEKYWPSFNLVLAGDQLVVSSSKSLDYARAQLQEELTEQFGEIDMSRVKLVTLPATDEMVKRGEMPGYAVLYQRENGDYDAIPGKLWRPDTSAIAAREGRIEDVRNQMREDAARRADERLRRDLEKRALMNEESRSIAEIIRGGPMPEIVRPAIEPSEPEDLPQMEWVPQP